MPKAALEPARNSRFDEFWVRRIVRSRKAKSHFSRKEDASLAILSLIRLIRIFYV